MFLLGLKMNLAKFNSFANCSCFSVFHLANSVFSGLQHIEALGLQQGKGTAECLPVCLCDYLYVLSSVIVCLWPLVVSV